MTGMPTVTQSNHLIEASYRLTLNEQRLLLACIAQLDPRKPMPRKRLTVYAHEFAETYQLSENKAYEQLKEATDRFYERDLKIHDGKAKERYRWLDFVKYHDGEGYVSISFTQWVAPYLTLLNREFTSYQLRAIASLRSTYAIRLFQLLAQYRLRGQREITVQILRERLDLGDKYERFSNLKARVIQPAINELNSKSTMVVGWRPKRRARGVTAIVFTFAEKLPVALEV